MSPLSSSSSNWGSWSWNESDEEGIAVNIDTGQLVYAPGNPPITDPNKPIKDWPPVDFGD